MDAYYQSIASEYIRHRRVHPGVLRSFISIGELGSASSVLDVGCGTGNYLLALSEIVGCDRTRTHSSLQLISEEAFDVGMKRLEHDLRSGPIPYTWRYLLRWGVKRGGD